MQDDMGCDIRLDRFGQADLDYYLDRAHRMRGELLRSWYWRAKSALARLLCQPLFGCHGPAASH